MLGVQVKFYRKGFSHSEGGGGEVKRSDVVCISDLFL